MEKDTPVLKIILTNAALFAVLAFSSTSHAADKLFDLIVNAQSDVDARAAMGQVSFSSVAGNELKIGDEFDISMPDGTIVSGELILNRGSGLGHGQGEEFISESTDSKVLILDNDSGSLEVHLVGSTIAGITLNDTNNAKIYRARIDGSGTGNLAEVDPNTLLCFDMPEAPDDVVSAESAARIPDGLTEDIVRNLESRPGATNTIYIDNWGGVVEGTIWNEAYNSNNPIDYTPYSFDNDPTTFSNQDINYIWLAYAEMADDYADLDVNITTSQSVYDSTPVPNRSRIIATTKENQDWLGLGFTIGGVAFLYSFGDEFRNTGWTFNETPGSTGMTHSHEAGHQMGLNHDGTSDLAYYGGHGSWGPIMGAPFGKQYVQWSKGEYPDADNKEDDLTRLTSVLGLRPDDAGDAPTSSNALEATTGTNYMITQDGITPDTDVFSFTLGESQEVTIDVLPTLGNGGESTGANAAFNVDLKNSAGTVLASIASSDNTPLRPDTNTFSFSDDLGPDTYYLTVDAVSPDLNWATGFGEYANGGEYRLIADFDPGTPPGGSPGITAPAPGSTLAGYTDTFTWASNGTEVVKYWVYAGSTAGGFDYGSSGSLSPDTLNYSPTALPLDGSTVYVTLFWIQAGDEKNEDPWQSVEYTYTAAAGSAPTFTSPVSGGTLAGVSDTFEWTSNDSGATQYWLYLGSEVGSREYYDSGLLGDANASNVEFIAADGDDTVGYLPTDGSKVYGRLWYRATSSNRWLYVDDTFTAATSGGPAITSPVPGSAISGTSVTLNWEPGAADVSEWWVYVGTSVGEKDIYNSGSLGTALSDSVTMPANGSTAHVTLWFKIGDKWRNTNYVYESNSDT